MKNLFSLAVLLLLTFLASKISAQKPEPAQLVSQSAGNSGTIYCDGLDILNTEIFLLRFDFQKETAEARAVITAQVAKDSALYAKFSAKGNWEISSVKVDGKEATYLKDTSTLFVFFTAVRVSGQGLKIEVNYKVIKPKAGMYFINPRNTVPGQAQQIWAQGEPEDNSWWMPTHEMGCLDKMTGSITMTVPSKFKTISNGNLVASKKLKGGLRRDTWRLDKPHASYLFTFVVGEFEVVKDNSGRVPVEFYVQKGYAQHARDIFPQTVALLDFFSERFGPYPWPNYKQVILENYTFGAMENTTATTFHKSFQGTARELKGETRNLAVTAHEMFHHWFGDLTTAEGWGDLTVNEGFATYSEWLAIEHFLGKEAADEWFKIGRNQYFDQCYKRDDAHPLIDTARAKDPIAMFDRHSYKKGGWILRQLNEMVGDSLFFASCRLYLTTNSYQYAQWSDLQSAFESTFGRNFGWYFEQWGQNVGHPIIEVYTVVMGDKLVVGLEQTQGKKYGWEEFFLDVPTVIHYENGETEKGTLTIGNVEFQTITIPLKAKLAYIAIDPERVALVDWRWHMSLSEHQTLLRECKNFPVRSDALDSLTAHKAELKNWSQICDRATDDMSPSIASRGLANVPIDSLFTEKMAAIYLGDGLDTRIRKAALSKLDGPEWQKTFVALCEDESLEIQALALQKLLTIDTAGAIQIAKAKWAIIQKGKPVIHERYITKALLDVLLNAKEINFKLCLKSVCENGGPYVWGELEGSEQKLGPMVRWITSLERQEREDFFLPWLRKFGDRFSFTLKYFGPKVPAASTSTGK